ncbi:uncharacterized protein LOC108623914 [Ceratina calcarata]|uniref:Uncharacterized protein LOC108623914 n=1 Tax=Ceratina calcarata TaxID=156304 RepID=A0AAJ7IWD7_9HYME|nr:uncharacterized protein LOC108623914 [Ceratina calcarata]
MSNLKAKGCLFLASSLCDGVEDNDIKQVTTLLLNNEANPNTLIPTYGVTPFHLAIGNDSEAFAEEVTKLFLRHGGNPNVRSTDGLTPVHVAAAWGRVTVLELLLANGGDPLSLDDEGRNPFHYAFDGKYYKAIVLLGKYCDIITKPEEKTITYRRTFDKLLLNNGNVIAEYTALQIPDVIGGNLLNESELGARNDEVFTHVDYVKSFNSCERNLNVNDNQIDVNAALQVREEMFKEKSLVNEIINQLSNSLKSNSVEQDSSRDHEDYKLTRNPYRDNSLSSTLSTDNSMVYNMKDKFKYKPKNQSLTPKTRRKFFGQNDNFKVPLIPMRNADDTIISKSPNFLTNDFVTQKYLSPKRSNRGIRSKAFTPCTRRKKPFQLAEINLGKVLARSTPRRRRFYREYSPSLKKCRRNIELTSSEYTSPDSGNSLSPDRNYRKELNYNFNKDIVIKLEDNKYDDDVPLSLSESETDACVLQKDLIGLRNNFSKCNIEETNFNNLLNVYEGKHSEINLKTDNNVDTFKENLITLLSSSSSTTSYFSVQEDYKYEDEDEGIAFLERRTYALSLCKPIDCASEGLFPKSLNLGNNKWLTDEALRNRLIKLGENPGPITNTTRSLYLKRLTKLEEKTNNVLAVKSDRSKVTDSSATDCSECDVESFLKYGDWVNDIGRYKIMERNAFKEFCSTSPSRKWREGNSKTCFNYLLLDPRVTKDLPCCTEKLTSSSIWSRFISAIFYVGKGTRNRPYSHLKDAFDTWVSHRNPENAKIRHILNIWNDGYGVICLHMFQNSIPVEAYTREAAIIDALGMQQLKNCRSGDYYGITATWNKEEKRCFGRYLLYQAMQIFICEGERQIFPQNL